MAATDGEAGCVFCDIVAGRRPSRTELESVAGQVRDGLTRP